MTTIKADIKKSETWYRKADGTGSLVAKKPVSSNGSEEEVTVASYNYQYIEVHVRPLTKSK